LSFAAPASAIRFETWLRLAEFSQFDAQICVGHRLGEGAGFVRGRKQP
jgi:hypothetical protein